MKFLCAMAPLALVALTLHGCGSGGGGDDGGATTVTTTGIPEPGPGPHVAAAWSANVVSGSTLGEGRGKFFYDAPGQQWRLSQCVSVPLFSPDGETCMDQLAKNVSVPTGHNLNMTIGQGSDAVCKQLPIPYYDILFLSLLPSMGTRQGVKTVDGVTCEVWTVSLQQLNMSTCIAADGVPREHNMTSGIAFKAALDHTFRFSNVSVGPPADAAFAPSEVCEKRYPMPPCPNGDVTSFDVYRVRSAREPNSLSNRNTGDALGDMAFFCGVGGMDETQLVSHWSMQANSSWGQYSYCLYAGGKNVCYGDSGNSVGRESANGLGKGAVQGQCSTNEVVGSWFSFPESGACPEGAQVGAEGCTWAAKSLRTVSAGCILNDRGLKESCNKERGHAPMAKSAAIFKAAFETADPAKGGCPDVSDVAEVKVLLV